MSSDKDTLWNRDDQFKNQFSTEFQKQHIENRWNIFQKLIIKHNFTKERKLKVLDLGCGDGINILGLKNILNSIDMQYEITGVDVNDDRLAKVKKRFPDVKVDKVDIVNDTLNEEFDLIIFNHVLEHIEEDEKAIKNLYSLVHDNGLIILGVPNEGCLIAKIRNNVLHRKILKYTDHVQFYTFKTLSLKVMKYFNICEVYREGYFMPHDRLAYEIKKYKFGRKLLSFMLKINPSQSAGLILGLTKK